jgi:hypothetical protein
MADRAHDAGALSYDPAADAASRYPDWTVATADLGGVVPEVLSWERQVILIDAGGSAPVRRSSLAHALAHLDLEHRWTLAGFFENREELEADRLAARRLIPLRAFLEAVAWSQDRDEVAAALDVDLPMLDARERDLSRGELRHLRRSSRAGRIPGS